MSQTPRPRRPAPPRRPPRWEGEDKAGDLGQDVQLQPEVYEEQASRQPQIIPILFAWTQPDEVKDRADYLTRLPGRGVGRGRGEGGGRGK